MPETRNPYDTGDRLDPHPWVKGDVASPHGLPRQATGDDYGRVDFDNDEGATVLTAWVQKTAAGYILRVDEHQDVELTIETSSDRQIREAAMQRLDAGLRVIAAEHAGAVFFTADGEPESFGAGNYVFTPLADGNGKRFVIDEQFVGTDSSDDDRVPNSWTWEAEQYFSEQGCWVTTAEGSAALIRSSSFSTRRAPGRRRSRRRHDRRRGRTRRSPPSRRRGQAAPLTERRHPCPRRHRYLFSSLGRRCTSSTWRSCTMAGRRLSPRQTTFLHATCRDTTSWSSTRIRQATLPRRPSPPRAARGSRGPCST
ncbi:hypothetical protein GCM10009805_14730 [Leucobacter chromiireducens subsp. solipictus]